MTPKIPSLALSPGLRDELMALTEAGLYESEEAFEAIACHLYARGVFSLGRAAEWSGLSIEMMKAALHRAGIVRQADEGGLTRRKRWPVKRCTLLEELCVTPEPQGQQVWKKSHHDIRHNIRSMPSLMTSLRLALSSRAR